MKGLSLTISFRLRKCFTFEKFFETALYSDASETRGKFLLQRLRIHYNCVGEMNIPNEPALPIPAVTVNTRKGVFVSYTTDDRPAV